ncbi:MAG: hypothetical protein ACO2ZZ_08515, partial [Cyclobacteriaceae bacterium]
MRNKSYTLKLLGILSLVFVNAANLQAQTKGMIIEPSSGTVLDPTSDGYISTSSTGFTNFVDETGEFEISMNSFPTYGIGETLADIANGPDYGFTDFSVDPDGAATYWTLDGSDNLIFRFRLADYRPNAKGYTVLIDTDQAFGAGDDVNYNSQNPGFEIAIVLRSKHEVSLINIDGQTSCPTPYKTYALSDYHQKSVSGIESGSNLDFFYDFYIPLADINTMTGGTITSSSPLRIAATTNISNTCALEGALSDIGGMDDSQCGGFEGCMELLIENQVATTPGGTFPAQRTSCPTISGTYPVGTINVRGTAEAGSTMKFYLNGTEVPSASVSADGTTGEYTSGDIVTTSTSDVIRVTATASGYSESRLACNSTTITNTSSCFGNSPTVTLDIPGNSGSVEFTVAESALFDATAAAAATLKFFTNGEDISSQGTFSAPSLSAGIFTYTFSMTGGGVKIPCGSSVVTLEDTTNGLCPTASNSACRSNSCGSQTFANSPVITTSPIETTTTSISGTSDANANVSLYVDGSSIGSVTANGSGSWIFNSLDLSAYGCKDLTATANFTGSCTSTETASINIGNRATAPTITSGYCAGTSSPLNIITGTSSEAEGATITVYFNSSQLGTTTVNEAGTWAFTYPTGITTSGTLEATATDTENCKSSSTLGSATVNATPSQPSITWTTPINAGATSISFSGGTGTKILYMDGSPVYDNSDNLITTTGSSFTGLSSTSSDSHYIYEGAELTLVVDNGTCESPASDAYEVPCNDPSNTIPVSPTTISNHTSGNTVAITVGDGSSNPQNGVIYQFYNSSTAFGPSLLGAGSQLSLSSSAITSNVTLTPKAYKIYPSGCETDLSNVTVTLAGAAVFEFGTQPTSTTICVAGTATLTATVSNANGTPTYQWQSSSTSGSGFSNISGATSASYSAPTSSAGITYYKLLATDNDGTITSDEVTVTINELPDATLTLSSDATICSGATATITLNSSVSGINYQLRDDSDDSNVGSAVAGTGGNITFNVTPSASTTYNVLATNGTTSCNAELTDKVTITVNPVPDATLTLSSDATICSGAT